MGLMPPGQTTGGPKNPPVVCLGLGDYCIRQYWLLPTKVTLRWMR